jgi:hypothetical protein
VRIDGPQGQPALQFAAVEATPSWKSLTRLTPTFDQLVIRGADLTVTRPDANHLEIGGIRIALNSSGQSDAAQQFADWLFEQDEILILDSRLTWENAAQHAPPLPLTQVNLLLRNTLLTHRAALTATPPTALAAPSICAPASANRSFCAIPPIFRAGRARCTARHPMSISPRCSPSCR